VISTVAQLRAAAIEWTLRAQPSVGAAVEALGFVQYDPIRAPARAQDLILAQRVTGYRAGDLDRAFATLDLDEGHLHVYGALPRSVLSLVHPRLDADGAPVTYTPSRLESDVLAEVRARGVLHPRDARTHLGNERTVNAWGGMSAATTKALESLHRHGLLRVSHRVNGTRVYEPAPPRTDGVAPDERARQMALLLARLLAPVQVRTLRETLAQLRRYTGGIPQRPGLVDDLRRSGDLDGAVVDGVAYVWPSDLAAGPTGDGTTATGPDRSRVRFLAPFDPLVWDRRRFEHLWAWPYRFEAYTPAAKRRFGYYALPVLWRDTVVGWVNAAITPSGVLDVRAGYTADPPRTKAFTQAFDREVSRLQAMLR
jgi:uncharacterized protein YcaQ